jgi:hypothetical protein
MAVRQSLGSFVPRGITARTFAIFTAGRVDGDVPAPVELEN